MAIVRKRGIWFEGTGTLNEQLAAAGVPPRVFGDSVPWLNTKAYSDAVVAEVVRGGYDEISVLVKDDRGVFWTGGVGWGPNIDLENLAHPYDANGYFIDQLVAAGIDVYAVIICAKDKYYDGTGGRPDYRNPSSLDHIDWTNTTATNLLITTIEETMDRYPNLSGIDLDYIRTGVNGTNQAEIDANYALVTPVVAAAKTYMTANHPTMKLRGWGHHSSYFFEQGQDRARWINEGKMDMMMEGQYKRPDDWVQYEDTYPELFGDDLTSPTYPAVTDKSTVILMPSFYKHDVDDNVIEMTTNELHWSFYHSFGYTEGGDFCVYSISESTTALMDYLRDTILDPTPNTKYVKDLSVETAAFYGGSPDEVYAPGEFIYRRRTDVTVLDASGNETSLPSNVTVAGDNDPAHPLDTIPILNSLRLVSGMTDSEDFSAWSTIATGTLAVEPGGGYRVGTSDAWDGISYSNIRERLWDPNGARHTGYNFFCRLKVESTVNNQDIKLRCTGNGGFVERIITLPTVGTYEVISPKADVVGFNGAESTGLYLYPDVAGVADLIVHNVSVMNIENENDFYQYTPAGFGETLQVTDTTDFYSATLTSGIISSEVFTPIAAPVVTGKYIGDGVRAWMAGKLTNKTADGITLTLQPMFDKADDKGSDIILVGFETASDDWLQIEMDQLTGVIAMKRQVSGAAEETLSSTLAYSKHDVLTVSLTYDATETKLTCTNVTTAQTEEVTIPGAVSFRDQGLWKFGARVGRSANQSAFYLSSVTQNPEAVVAVAAISKRVDFGRGFLGRSR